MSVCCGNSPRVYIDHKWVCSDCGSIIGNIVDNEQMNFSDVSKYFDYDIGMEDVSKCDCGSDRTYGPGSNTHSTWCKMYKGN